MAPQSEMQQGSPLFWIYDTIQLIKAAEYIPKVGAFFYQKLQYMDQID